MRVALPSESVVLTQPPLILLPLPLLPRLPDDRRTTASDLLPRRDDDAGDLPGELVPARRGDGRAGDARRAAISARFLACSAW